MSCPSKSQGAALSATTRASAPAVANVAHPRCPTGRARASLEAREHHQEHEHEEQDADRGAPLLEQDLLGEDEEHRRVDEERGARAPLPRGQEQQGPERERALRAVGDDADARAVLRVVLGHDVGHLRHPQGVHDEGRQEESEQRSVEVREGPGVRAERDRREDHEVGAQVVGHGVHPVVLDHPAVEEEDAGESQDEDGPEARPVDQVPEGTLGRKPVDQDRRSQERDRGDAGEGGHGDDPVPEVQAEELPREAHELRHEKEEQAELAQGDDGLLGGLRAHERRVPRDGSGGHSASARRGPVPSPGWRRVARSASRSERPPTTAAAQALPRATPTSGSYRPERSQGRVNRATSSTPT